jgi:hypothetical protein
MVKDDGEIDTVGLAVVHNEPPKFTVTPRVLPPLTGVIEPMVSDRLLYGSCQV